MGTSAWESVLPGKGARIASVPSRPRNDGLNSLSKGSTSISYAYDMDGIPLPSDSGFVIIGSVH